MTHEKPNTDHQDRTTVKLTENRVIESLRGNGTLSFNQIQERAGINGSRLALSLAHLIQDGRVKAKSRHGHLFYELAEG